MSNINVDTIRSRTGGPVAADKGVVVTGTTTSTDGYFSGNVSIAGTLTYEDVTNQDVIGLVTARSGIYVGNAAAAAGIGITLGTGALGDASFSGIVTAGTCFKTGNGVFGAGIGVTITGAGDAVFAGIASVGTAITMYGSTGIISATSYYGDITGDATGLSGTPNIDVGNITGIGITVSGICTVATGTNLNGYKVEEGSYDSDALNGEFDFEFENGHIQTHTGSTAGTYFPDFRVSSSQSLDSVMGVGDVVSATLIVAASNTAHYCTTGIKIDNSTSNLTIEWIGSAAASAGKGAGYDIYAFTIQKTAATPAYLIIVNALDAG
jgi:hypothetical protein